MKNISTWEDEEVKTLFKFVEIKKSEAVPLVKIFAEFANHTKRKQNSVRNYYYKEIKNLKDNLDRANCLDIDINKHFAKKPEHFSEQDKQQTIKKIQNLVDSGYSVRKACLELSGGNATQMIRLQNKYRSSKKQKDEGINNIIKMPTKKPLMNDEDINALFIGLVRLVKQQEAARVKQALECEMQHANLKLEKAMYDIVSKQNEIEKLKKEIAVLKTSMVDGAKSTVANAENANKIKSANLALKGFVQTRVKNIKNAMQ